MRLDLRIPDALYPILSTFLLLAIGIKGGKEDAKSTKDQGHFYSMAYSSLMEALNQILIAKDLGWVSLDAYEELRGHMEGLSAVITALRKSILSKQPPP